MTSPRVLAMVAGAAVAALLGSAITAAAGDVSGALPRGSPARARPVTFTQSRDGVDAPARRRRWSANRRPRVSAGVLVRAASRKPLDRAACAPAAPGRDGGEGTTAVEGREGQGTPGHAEGPCPQSGSSKTEHIEIDWHADPATP